MKQIDRIRKMEELMDNGREVTDRLDRALDDYLEFLPDLEELETYYSSKEWKQDFEDDEDGKLPSDLKRGVLSEDGLFDFFQENNDLNDKMRSITDTEQLSYQFESGYVNGLLTLAGNNNERLGRSYIVVYCFDKEYYLSELQELFGYDDDILTESRESLKEKLEDWLGKTSVCELIEKELGPVDAVLDFRSRSVLEDAGGENCGFSELFFIEDGFVALFDETAILFLMGNNE